MWPGAIPAPRLPDTSRERGDLVGVQADIGQDVAGDAGRELRLNQRPRYRMKQLRVGQLRFDRRVQSADHVIGNQ